MSWKATAFVKEITTGITVAEKMVMFVLADYHNTTTKSAWPSIPVLAKESLMSERTVYRILDSLEGLRIRRLIVPGKPNSYQFIGLDTPDIKSVLKMLTPDSTPDTTTAKKGTAIRKEEPVLEPVFERGGTAPPVFSQPDFDQRDLRKMSAAVLEAERRPSSVGGMDDKAYFEWLCMRAGVTVERGLYLEGLQRKWPVVWSRS